MHPFFVGPEASLLKDPRPLLFDQPACSLAFSRFQDFVDFRRLDWVMKDQLRGAVSGKHEFPEFHRPLKTGKNRKGGFLSGKLPTVQVNRETNQEYKTE